MMKKQAGQILIISVIFLAVILVITGILISYVSQNTRAGRASLAAEQALQLADAGIDKAIWRLNNTAGAYTGETNTALGPGVFDVAITNLSGNLKQITADGYVPNRTARRAHRQVKVQVSIDTTTVSFLYGVQVGDGGLVMSNNSRINGSVFSHGTINGANGARITGDAYSAGSAGLITDRIQIDGSAYAHTINNAVTIGGSAYGYTMSNVTVGGNAKAYSLASCTIGGSAWYTIKSSCSIGGTQTTPHPGEPDPAPQPMPIADQQITDWKNQAAGGGTIVGSYTLSNGATATIGPKKITGSLTLSNNAVLTLTGPIWAVGDISISNNAIIRLDPSYGNNSEVLIADGQIQVSNNAIFQRAGPSSYIMMLTTNNGSSAFQISNNADALIAYAANGTVNISNGVQVREVVGWRVSLSNNAIITYESGLNNVNFTSGPGGSWVVVRGTWRITD